MNQFLTITHSWIEEFIIGRDICPFAAKPFFDKRFRLVVCQEKNHADFFRKEQEFLIQSTLESLSNSFLVYPFATDSFLDFLDFYYDCEAELSPNLQMVCFHPHFYFESTDKKARINWVNRSPYPSLHLLRRDEIAAVVTDQSMGERISKANEHKLEKMSEEEFQEMTSKWQT